MDRESTEAAGYVLRYLGLGESSRASKAECAVLYWHMTMHQSFRSWANRALFTSFVHFWDNLQSTDGIDMLCDTCYKLPLCLDKEYSGTLAHWMARDRFLCTSDTMPYVVALLRYIGCDFYGQPDSRGEAACLAVARAMGSQSWAMEAELLFVWLQRRHEPDYVPCERTRALVGQ